MSNWDVSISGKLPQDLQSSLMRKHYIKKEPFSKVVMHEMHLGELIEDMKEVHVVITINTASKLVELNPVNQ